MGQTKIDTVCCLICKDTEKRFNIYTNIGLEGVKNNTRFCRHNDIIGVISTPWCVNFILSWVCGPAGVRLAFHSIRYFVKMLLVLIAINFQSHYQTYT